MKQAKWRGSYVNSHIFAFILGCRNIDYLLDIPCARSSTFVKQSLGKEMPVFGDWKYTVNTHNTWVLNHKYGEFAKTRYFTKHTTKDKKKKKK